MADGPNMPFGHDPTVQLLTTLLMPAPEAPPLGQAQQGQQPRPMLDHQLVASITRARIALAGCVSKALAKAREAPDAAQADLLKVRRLVRSPWCIPPVSCTLSTGQAAGGAVAIAPSQGARPRTAAQAGRACMRRRLRAEWHKGMHLCAPAPLAGQGASCVQSGPSVAPADNARWQPPARLTERPPAQPAAQGRPPGRRAGGATALQPASADGGLACAGPACAPRSPGHAVRHLPDSPSRQGGGEPAGQGCPVRGCGPGGRRIHGRLPRRLNTPREPPNPAAACCRAGRQCVPSLGPGDRVPAAAPCWRGSRRGRDRNLGPSATPLGPTRLVSATVRGPNLPGSAQEAPCVVNLGIGRQRAHPEPCPPTGVRLTELSEAGRPLSPSASPG